MQKNSQMAKLQKKKKNTFFLKIAKYRDRIFLEGQSWLVIVEVGLLDYCHKMIIHVIINLLFFVLVYKKKSFEIEGEVTTL